MKNYMNPKGLVIIPYRGFSSNHPNKYHKMMNDRILINKCKSVGLDVLVVEQSEQSETEKKFNRGLLLNIGVASVQKHDYNYYIMHDIDIIPDDTLIKTYLKYPINPIHYGVRGQRYSNDPDFIGGCIGVSKSDYLSVNGNSNLFWGWGGEDQVFRNRLLKNGYIITIPEYGDVIDIEGLSISEKLLELKTKNLKEMNKNEIIKTDNMKINGLRNVEAHGVVEVDGVLWIKTN
jgi:hypothetical protein